MKTTKKVRKDTKSKAKTPKKTIEKVTKTKKNVIKDAKVAKKPIKKSDKIPTSRPTAALRNATSAAEKNTTQKQLIKRKNRELTATEYDAFVTKTAILEHVASEELVTVDRRTNPSSAAEKLEKSDTSKERRPKVQRRRQIDPTTCERDYSQDEIEFMNALDEYKRNSGRMFPTCSEVLEVFRGLGYTKHTHEESIEISANPESGDIYITSTETNTVSRPDATSEPSHQIATKTEHRGSTSFFALDNEDNNDNHHWADKTHGTNPLSGTTPFFL